MARQEALHPASEPVAVLQQEERDDHAEDDGDEQLAGDQGGVDEGVGELRTRRGSRRRCPREPVDVGAVDVEGAVLDEPVLDVVDALAQRRTDVVELVGDCEAHRAEHECQDDEEPEQRRGCRKSRLGASRPEPQVWPPQHTPEQDGDDEGQQRWPYLTDEPDDRNARAMIVSSRQL